MAGLAYNPLPWWLSLLLLALVLGLAVLWIWALTEEPDDEERSRDLYDWNEEGL